MVLVAGEVFAGGQGSWGQTGLGHTSNAACLHKVPGLEGQHVTQVVAGSRHTLVLSSGEVWGFGCNESGQLGSPGGGSRLAPSRVHGLPGGSDAAVLLVAAGGHHSAALLRRVSGGSSAVQGG